MAVASGTLTPSLKSKSTLVLLTLLLLWAGGVRTWFASQDLHAGRFWDERYGVKNTRAVVQGGSLRPVSFYYPSLSYLPHSVVLSLTQRLVRLADPGYSLFEGGRLKAEGDMICRSIQVIFGLLSIFLTFTLSRDLFGEDIALLAALLLAVSPQHIRLSAFYKPDIMLLFLTLLTLTWTLRALRLRSTASSWLSLDTLLGLTPDPGECLLAQTPKLSDFC